MCACIRAECIILSIEHGNNKDILTEHTIQTAYDSINRALGKAVAIGSQIYNWSKNLEVTSVLRFNSDWLSPLYFIGSQSLRVDF